MSSGGCRPAHIPRIASLLPGVPVVLLSADEIVAASSGEVTTDALFEPGTRTPVLGGLYCPRIFGTSGAADRFGHIRLHHAVPHPWLRADEGSTDWAMLTVVPVLPPGLRLAVHLANEGVWIENDLTLLYEATIRRSRRLKRLIELAAPAEIVVRERRMVAEAVTALLDNENVERPPTPPGKRLLRSVGSWAIHAFGRGSTDAALRALGFARVS